MRRHFHIAAMSLTLVSAVAVAAGAQDAERGRVTRTPGTFIYQMGPDAVRLDMRHGRLGITVDLRPDAARDSIGARVSGVTPGGPADHAGVQTGDIITRLNGTRIAVDGGRPGDEDGEQSRPGMRLINLASRLEAGDTARVDLRRGTQNLTLTFVADRTDMDQLVERMRIPGPMAGSLLMEPQTGRMPFMMGDQPRGQVHVMINGGGMGDLEMVKVTPQLAEGLGITEGVLVISVDSGTTLGLRAGDVITSIAGRAPTDPVHAMRILSSYDAGENVSIDVMRHGRRATVAGKIPEMRNRVFRARPSSFDQDELPRMMEEMRNHLRELPGEIQGHAIVRMDGKV